MIKNMMIAFATLAIVACGNAEKKEEKKGKKDNKDTTAQVEKNYMYYGDTITADDAKTAQDLVAMVQTNDSVQAKVNTKIIETCTKKGCWMEVDMGDKPPMRVRFLDYAFFVPTEGVEGKNTIFEGIAYRDTLSVEALRHYAYDAGKDSTEILAITKPEAVVSFTATGVIIEK